MKCHCVNMGVFGASDGQCQRGSTGGWESWDFEAIGATSTVGSHVMGLARNLCFDIRGSLDQHGGILVILAWSHGCATCATSW
jgi:hypothetical protein